MNLPVKEFCRSYGQKSSVLFFGSHCSFGDTQVNSVSGEGQKHALQINPLSRLDTKPLVVTDRRTDRLRLRANTALA